MLRVDAWNLQLSGSNVFEVNGEKIVSFVRDFTDTSVELYLQNFRQLLDTRGHGATESLLFQH